MAEITTDKEPGFYTGDITVNITFPPNVRKAIITRDDVAPVFSEIIAYDKDTAGNRRPFLAVTQDGRGNVVYDGGFPKYYNNNVVPGPIPTTFAGLNGSCKFFHNALKFCANPTKIARGNNKILVLGNTPNYQVFDVQNSMRLGVGAVESQPYGMRDSFDPAFAIAGMVPTYMNLSNFPGGKVDITFALLDQYAACVVLISNPATAPATFLTATSANELATWRAAGNGVILITDHCGDVYTSVADAVARRSVFAADAILLAAPYGAYFSGNYDRKPVKVGDIRAENGDHPLFANIGNDEFIIGMESESIVFVDDHAADMVDPAVVHTYQLTTAGTHRINPLAQMNDGTIQVRPFRYDIIDPSNLLLQDARARTVGSTYSTVKKSFDLKMFYNTANPPTLSGYITRNNVRHGTFLLTNNVMTTKFCSGNSGGFEFLNTDKVGFDIQIPFLYKTTTTIGEVDRTELNNQWSQPSQVGKLLAATPDYSGIRSTEALRSFWQYANTQYRDRAADPGNVFGIWPRVLPRVKRALSGSLGMCDLWVAVTPAEWTTTKPSFPNEGDTAVVATDGTVYSWWVKDGIGTWESPVDKVGAMFGVGRLLRNNRNGDIYRIDATKLTKQ